MKGQRTEEPERGELSAEEVADYLARHPDFFERRPRLLGQLEIPHDTDGDASLIERQVSVLRDRTGRLEARLNELVDTARANEAMLDRMHRLTLALIEARTFDEVVNALQDALRTEFAIDEVALIVYRDGAGGESVGPARLLDPGEPELAALASVREELEPRCGPLDHPSRTLLFGERAARIASAALVPVGAGGQLGILGTGSHREDHFHPDMGTLFLSRIGELVGAALGPHLR